MPRFPYLLVAAIAVPGCVVDQQIDGYLVGETVHDDQTVLVVATHLRGRGRLRPRLNGLEVMDGRGDSPEYAEIEPLTWVPVPLSPGSVRVELLDRDGSVVLDGGPHALLPPPRGLSAWMPSWFLAYDTPEGPRHLLLDTGVDDGDPATIQAVVHNATTEPVLLERCSSPGGVYACDTPIVLGALDRQTYVMPKGRTYEESGGASETLTVRFASEPETHRMWGLSIARDVTYDVQGLVILGEMWVPQSGRVPAIERNLFGNGQYQELVRRPAP